MNTSKQRCCILHVGMHRTGSSAIQKSLHGRLSSANFSYLDIGQANHSQLLNKAFSHSGKQQPGDSRAQLVTALDGCTGETVVLSADSLSTMAEEELAELKAFLGRWFGEIRVVGYVRPPVAFMASQFQQRLKKALPSWQAIRPRYRFRFEKFDRLFGREQVQLWKFDPSIFPEGNVVRDFCARLGIPLAVESIVNVDEGMSRDAVALLYAYRLHHGMATTPAVLQREEQLVKTLSALPGPKLRFGEALLREKWPEIEGDVRWMEGRLGETLAEEPSQDGITSLEELCDSSPFAKTLAWLGSEEAAALTDEEYAAELDLLLAQERFAAERARRTGPDGGKRCILHVGMHKTGSSSIQESLHGKLHTPAFIYPDLGKANHSFAILRSFCTRPISQDVLFSAEQLARHREQERQRMAGVLESCHADQTLISAEALCALWPNELVEAKRFLDRHYANYRVVGYVRPPRAFMESAFQELLKERLPPWEHINPPYRFCFEKFDRFFGREQVQLWKFDPARFPGGNVVRDFCARLGIPLADEWIVHSNEGMSRDAVALLYAYRLRHGAATTPEAHKREVRLVRILSALPGPKLRFGEVLLSEKWAEIAEDVCWMEERLGESLAEKPSPDGIESLEELFAIGPATLAWLEEQLGRRIETRAVNRESLADWCEELSGRLHPAVGR